MWSAYADIRKTEVSDAAFACAGLTTFCGLDGLRLEVQSRFSAVQLVDRVRAATNMTVVVVRLLEGADDGR